ncbi:MAG: hypothetical protein FWF98_03415, partial [Dehalococcoidia bacterium]|nr:hypothetical protein [Dehalococcoidia bacterium]
MAEKWVESYEDLKKFIANHPEIKIDTKDVLITQEIRAEFYRHFNAVRNTLIKEYFTMELDKACELGRAYADISKIVQQDMSLEAIDIGSSLNGLLIEPLESLMSAVYTPLFNLLRGRTNEKVFILEAQKAVKDFFQPIFCEGYKRW